MGLLTAKGKLIASNLSPDVIDYNFKDKARVEDIYSLFKKDKSKRFLLNGKIILDAVKDGVKKVVLLDMLPIYQMKMEANM